MQTTPASLLERLRHPERPGDWEQFVQLYTPLLCLWARRLGVQGADMEDLVQDVFAVLVKELPQFRYDPQRRFRGWLWTILANKVRATRRGQAVPTVPLVEDALADRVEADEAEYRQFLVQRTLELIRHEFQPATWQAFEALANGGLPAADVAAKLDMSLAAVYAAKSRVLRRLRQELKGLLD